VSDALGKEALFYTALAPFLMFFIGFAFLFPVRDAIQPHWQSRLPPGLAHLAAMARHWLLCLFYVMAELWGSVALSLLFWTFANDIVKVEESTRFYALFGIGANLALVSVKFVNHAIHLLERHLVSRWTVTGWSAYVILLMGVVALCIASILLIYRWINLEVLTDPRFFSMAEQEANHAARPRMSLREAFRFLMRSRYLLWIAILVISYGIALNLIEVTWKTHLGLLHPDPKAYQDFMANFSFATGAVTLFLMLFVANNVIRVWGWTAAALAAPLVLLLTGTGFFGFILCEDASAPWLARFDTTPLAAAVLFGTIQNVLSKATKYSLFDPTKEMAYIPLDPESKVKGKAAIDVVGARLGKAGGSLIQQLLIGIFHSLRAVPGLIAVILLVVISGWIWAATRLGRAFAQLSRP
jgi:AAA family ATP:ADP antiporter